MLSYGLVRPFVGIENDKGKIVRSLEVVSISTKDPQGLPLPSAFLFSIHARFCNSLRWVQVQDQMQRGWPGNAFWHSCKTTFRKIMSCTIPMFRRLWLYFPRRTRALTYRLLLQVGNKMYGRTLDWVQRVPFGLYIKHGPGKFVPRGEGPALRLVEQYTKVVAPRLIDLLTTESKTYLVMTRIPGIPLQEAIQSFSYAERSQLAADIRGCVSQFRQIPNPNDAAICSADGGPTFDYRLEDPAGPFESEEAFNKHVIFRKSLRSAIHDHRHKIFFSHADFSPTNILVERGKFSEIVDFGCAGFYPEYLKYAKGIYGHFGLETAWPGTLSDAFSGLYKDELAAEKLLWENGNSF
jgi:hypothetical protein